MSELISKATIGFLLVVQLLVFTIFIFLMKYPNAEFAETSTASYSMFQHIHVMVFVGFGFLMTYLKKYGRSSVSFTLLLSGFVITWYLVVNGLIFMKNNSIVLNLDSVIEADEAAATFLISFGAVLGKFNILQYYLMAFIETVFYVANKYVIEDLFMAADAGGSMIVHEFGAFFGLGTSLILGLRGGPTGEKGDVEKGSYESDISSMIGTLFLWVFWPSFNGLTVSEAEKFRAIMNTYIALASSCTIVAVFTMVSSKNKDWKIEMVYIQNATLAAGVAVGSSANLKIQPWQAMLFGSVGGLLSVISFWYIQDFLCKKLRIHDTCGVFSLHGFPGIIGGLMGVIMTYLAKLDVYGPELYTIYPGMLPTGKDRSRLLQAVFQISSIFCCMSAGFVGGLIAGVLVVLAVPNLTAEERFIDETHWESYENE